CGEDELRIERDAEVGVEDDAEERTAARFAAAVGEEGVVGEDGADAGEDGVGGVAEEVNLGAGGWAGEPVRLVGETMGWRRGEFAVYREGGFEGDEGGLGADEVDEGFVEVAGWLLEDSDGDFDACGLEFDDASSADLRVGVDGSYDAAGDSGCDEGIGAGAGAAMMGTGLEGYVCGGVFGGGASFGGLLECCYLGVVAVGVEMGAFGDGLAIADENAAYLRVRGGEGCGLCRELEGSLHEALVLWMGRHALKKDSLWHRTRYFEVRSPLPRVRQWFVSRGGSRRRRCCRRG
ncbi:MAG: hypothetical protein JWP98_1816, partial [Edaphobacter sp.]|nr:hypothetical protein [Edaphobacter sp.]